VQSNQTEQEREIIIIIITHENKLRELRNTIKCNNIHVIGMLGEEKEKAENLFEEIIAEKFLKLGRTQKSRSRRHREPPTKINKSRSTSRHTVIKMAKK